MINVNLDKPRTNNKIKTYHLKTSKEMFQQHLSTSSVVFVSYKYYSALHSYSIYINYKLINAFLISKTWQKKTKTSLKHLYII